MGLAGAAKALRPREYTESYQLDLAEWILRSRERNYGFAEANSVKIAGDAAWIFRDVPSPQRCTQDRRDETPAIYCMNAKGVLARDNAPKDAFHLFVSRQRTAEEQPVCHIEGPAAGDVIVAPGQPHHVRVYSNCDTVSLTADGAPQANLRRAGLAFPAAGLVAAMHLAPGAHVIEAACACGAPGAQPLTARVNRNIVVGAAPAA